MGVSSDASFDDDSGTRSAVEVFSQCNDVEQKPAMTPSHIGVLH